MISAKPRRNLLLRTTHRRPHATTAARYEQQSRANIDYSLARPTSKTQGHHMSIELPCHRQHERRASGGCARVNSDVRAGSRLTCWAPNLTEPRQQQLSVSTSHRSSNEMRASAGLHAVQAAHTHACSLSSGSTTRPTSAYLGKCALPKKGLSPPPPPEAPAPDEAPPPEAAALPPPPPKSPERTAHEAPCAACCGVTLTVRVGPSGPEVTRLPALAPDSTSFCSAVSSGLHLKPKMSSTVPTNMQDPPMTKEMTFCTERRGWAAQGCE